MRMPHEGGIPSKKSLTGTWDLGSISLPDLMNKYYLQNIQHKIENGKDSMLVALYRDDELISQEWVVSVEGEQCWEFCQNMTMGNHFAFDVLADVMGEDRAAWVIDEWCFDPCWDEPGVKIDITPEDYLAARSCMCG